MKFVDNAIIAANSLLLSFVSNGSYYFIIIYTASHISKENILKGLSLVILLKFITYTFNAIEISNLSQEINKFVKQFASCVFTEQIIDKYISHEFLHFLNKSCNKDLAMKILNRISLLKIYFIENKDKFCSGFYCFQGASFPSYIFICNKNGKNLDIQTYFAIHHEIAHASSDGTLSKRIGVNLNAEFFILYIIFCINNCYFLFFAAISILFKNI